MQDDFENLVNEEQSFLEDISDAIRTAKTAGLVYVSDSQPGYKRLIRGNTFYFMYNNKRLTDPDELKRIKSLVLPLAWENVWICKHPNTG